MTNLCRDCKHCQWETPSFRGDFLLGSGNGPWCIKAMAHHRREPDLLRGGFKPLKPTQLGECRVDEQRSYPVIFDVLFGSCGRRGRWFEQVENKENK